MEDHTGRVAGDLHASEARSLAALFRVLGDGIRCKIVSSLIERELSVHEIVEVAGSSVSNVSHHLRLLRAARLVKYRKEQRRVFYSLDDDHVSVLISQGLEHVRHN